MGKRDPLLLVSNLFGFLLGCRTRVPREDFRRDSAAVRVEVRREVVHDTVLVRLPRVVERQTVSDSVSFLSNAYAQSEARVDTLGRLYHSLATRATPVRLPAQTEIIYRDSVVFRDRACSAPWRCRGARGGSAARSGTVSGSSRR